MMISCPLCEKQEKLAPIQEPFLCQNFTKFSTTYKFPLATAAAAALIISPNGTRTSLIDSGGKL